MKKKIVYATMLMSTIALLSTGFAAWIISTNDSETKDGTIAVDTVSNVSRLITDFQWEQGTLKDDIGSEYSYSKPRFDEGNPVICYGVPYGVSSDGNEDFYNTGSIDKETNGYNLFENLIISATFTVSNVSSSDSLDNVFSDVSLELKNVENTNNNFTEAQTENYISKTPSLNVENEITKWDSFKKDSESDPNSEYGIKLERVDEVINGGKDSKFKITIKFGWGSKFNYKNPYNYYKDSESVNIADLNTWLAKMETLLNGVSFKLTIATARMSAESIN